VGESKKRVAAIFLLPVWPLASLSLYSGSYGRRIAYRQLDMLPIRKPCATTLNLWSVEQK